ncbi:MAG: macro domain-containing protein, partial [Lachnospirales bacterium]
VWGEGKYNEFELLESCYAKSLKKALELGCKSIAFPLISTGVYGFPKDKALQIAVSVFSSFLMENEMQIILVVFDKKSFQLSGQLLGEIDSFIDANYIRKKRSSEYFGNTYRRKEFDIEYEAEVYEEYCPYKEEEDNDEKPLMSSSIPEKAMSLEEELENVGISFHDKLFELIDKSGMDNKDVWKRANLDRKHFSKIQCDKKYHPKKKTVMALCIALELNLEQANDLLARADWAFSPSKKVDLIVQKAIIDRQYDIYQLNLVLFKYTNEILGV